MPVLHDHGLDYVCESSPVLRLSIFTCFFLLFTSVNHIEAAKGDVPGCHNCYGKRVYEEGCPAINIPTKITSKRYYIFNLEMMNWFTANQFCNMHGMHLATIKNKQENEEMLELLKTGVIWDVWFGVTDLAEKGKHHHSRDGSPANFTAWLPGEPSGDGDERCVRFMGTDDRTGWADDSCDAEHYVACDLF